MSPVVARRRGRGAWFAIASLPLGATAHAQVVSPPAVTVEQPDRLDPDSPLAPMQGLGVEWPDLAIPDAAIAAPDAATAGTPAPPQGKAAKPVDIGEQRYAWRIEGIAEDEEAALRTRFEALSSLAAGEAKPANVAQIDRRARADAQTLRDLLRAAGHYDAEVDTRVTQPAGPGSPRLTVVLAATPGPRYGFTTVTVTGLDGTGVDRARFDAALAVKPGDPVDADRINAGVEALRAALGDRGYAFATVADPKVVIDHDDRHATLLLAVDPGKQMRFGAFRMSGKKVFGPRHVALISRLKAGDRYNAARLDDLRRALIQTGLVSVVQIAPVRTADPQVVDLAVHIEPAPPRTIAGAIGYGTGEGASVEVSWQHRNFFSPEGGVTFRGKLGTQEQLASALLRRGNFRSRDQVLTAQIAADHQNRPAYDARTISVSAGIERQTNIIWQKKWTYSYGTEFLGSDERDVIAATGAPRRRTYFIAAVPLSLAYDGSDDLLNPTRGYRLSARVSPELSLQGGAFGYARLQFDGSAYHPFGDRLVLAGRVRVGSIAGASADRIAPTRRFYSGGGGSVRGYSYQRIGPRDVDNDPIGGRSLAEFALEARIRFGNFGIVPFLDGGNIYTQALPRFTGMRYGTGIGGRYYTSFGPIRLDLGTPINPQPGDARVTVYVSLGQAF